jgi:hypothetical protein
VDPILGPIINLVGGTVQTIGGIVQANITGRNIEAQNIGIRNELAGEYDLEKLNYLNNLNASKFRNNALIVLSIIAFLFIISKQK